MEKLSIKAYAKRHKLSIFNVMKMIREGSVKSETVEEDGKEIYYILEDNAQKKSIESKTSQHDRPPKNLEKEVELLKEEIKLLRREVEMLKSKIQ